MMSEYYVSTGFFSRWFPHVDLYYIFVLEVGRRISWCDDVASRGDTSSVGSGNIGSVGLYFFEVGREVELVILALCGFVVLRGDTSSVAVLRVLVGCSRVCRGVVPNAYFFRGAHDAVAVHVQAEHLRYILKFNQKKKKKYK